MKDALEAIANGQALTLGAAQEIARAALAGGVPEQGLREPAETISANSPWAIENEEALSAAYAVAFDKWRIVQPPYKASFRAMVRTAIHAYLAALERPRPALPPLESWHKHECRGSSTDSEAHDPCFCVCGATSNDRGKTWAALPAPEPPPQKCDNCGRSPGSGKGSSAFTVCNDCWDARGAALPAEPQGISGASLPGLDCVAPLYVPKYRPATEEEKRAARTVVPAEHAPPDPNGPIRWCKHEECKGERGTGALPGSEYCVDHDPKLRAWKAIEWAVSLLEIHDGVKVNPNSQWWLAELRAAQTLVDSGPQTGNPPPEPTVTDTVSGRVGQWRFVNEEDARTVWRFTECWGGFGSGDTTPTGDEMMSGPFWWRWPSVITELLSGLLWAVLLWPWPTAARIPLIVIGALAYELWLDRNGWSWEDVIYRLAGVYLLEVTRLVVRT